MMRRVRGVVGMTSFKASRRTHWATIAIPGCGKRARTGGSKRAVRVGDLAQQGRRADAALNKSSGACFWFCCSGGLLARHSAASRMFGRAGDGKRKPVWRGRVRAEGKLD
jgi:hypothetical protein